MSAVLQAALDALAAGISVWPPRQDSSKAPDGSWKIGQSQRAAEAQILDWYKEGRTGLGFITGSISGNLEVIDADDRSTWSEYVKLCRDSGLGPLLDRVMAGYIEKSPNGMHLLFRCSVIEGNQKLAQRKDGKTILETRGESGFLIVAPSHGGVNINGPYVLESGHVSTIATITPEERGALFDIARMFDEMPKPVESASRLVSAVGRPGDDFNARSRWEDVLEPHGWTRVGGRLGVISWRRPGKDRGISATTNHADSDLLYVFSTSTGFESERGYSKFSAYAMLNHHGDFRAAAHELGLQGYGIEVPDNSDVDLSGILSRGAGDVKAATPDVLTLMRVPGVVGDIAEWINASAIKPQPVLALGASIAAFSAILGRKVRTETDLRSNLYVLGVGETGCGKERARQAIGALFDELGIGKQLGDSFASDSAVEAAMSQSPTRLYLIDEMGYFMGTMRDEQAPAHVKSIVPVLLRMYSSSDGVYRKRTYATVPQARNKKDDKDGEIKDAIDQPSLSLYGTTVPGNFYANITKAHLSNGLVSRLLVFESTDPDPEIRWTDLDKRKVPEKLRKDCEAWAKASTNAYPEGDLASLYCRPLVVKATIEARDIFDGLEATMRRRRAEERDAGRDQGPFTRVAATAAKMALIRACGVNPEHPEITEADAEWGCGMAWGLTESFMARVGDAAPENKAEEALQKVLAVVSKRKSVSRGALLRSTKMYSDALDKVVKTLIESGEITMDIEKATNGKVKTTYSKKQLHQFPEQLHQTEIGN